MASQNARVSVANNARSGCNIIDHVHRVICGVSNRKGEVGMLRYGLVILSIGSLVFQSGCAEQKPKPGGVTTVTPPIASKATDAKPDAGKKGETPDSGDSKTTEPTEDGDKKATPPGDAGSTTGGGTETPGEDEK